MRRRVVITGIGSITPCGEGRQSLWEAAIASRTGLSRLEREEFEFFPLSAAGLVRDFEAAKFVVNRKSLKVMCRDIQMAVAASFLARRDAGLENAALDPERSGVCIGAGLFSHDLEELADCFRMSTDEEGVFDTRLLGQSGMSHLFPLWLLKYLPNMPACHVSIFHGLRGPNNTVTTDSAASAAAFEEALRVIERGSADLMFCGGAESKINPAGLLRYHSVGSLKKGEPDGLEYAVFTNRSCGIVPGEGSTLLILEELEHAVARKAPIYAEVLGAFSCVSADGLVNGSDPSQSQAYAIAGALSEAGALLKEVDAIHLSANGVREEEQAEAVAVAKTFEARSDKPTLIATKNLTGFLGFAAAATEIALAAMSLKERRQVPSVLVGESLLKEVFKFSSQEAALPNACVLINHFTKGLSDHCVVLKSFGGKA